MDSAFIILHRASQIERKDFGAGDVGGSIEFCLEFGKENEDIAFLNLISNDFVV